MRRRGARNAGLAATVWVRRCALLMTVASTVVTVGAHLNSPHVFLEEMAGSYPIILVVHMPPAIPGEAELQVRLQDRRPDEQVQVLFREVPPQGERFAPDWAPAEPSAVDPDFYTAPVPLMVYGLWHVQVRVEGARGKGQVEVPIMARVAPPRTMGAGLGLLLGGLAALFFASLFQVFQALGRDVHRRESDPLRWADIRRGRLLGIGGLVFFVLFFAFVGFQWHRTNLQYLTWGTPPLSSDLVVIEGAAVSGERLSAGLIVTEPGGPPLIDVKPDHGKMMHLLAVKLPDASYLLHIHPRMVGPGRFRFAFTPPEAGAYKFFGDILRRSGIGETVTNVLEVAPGDAPPEFRFEDPDDSHSFQPALGEQPLLNRNYEVGDGLSVRWLREGQGPIQSGEYLELRFELTGSDGERVFGLEPYMGMAGHLLIMRSDAEVFAHVHPMGTLAGRMSMAMREGEMPMAQMLHQNIPSDDSAPMRTASEPAVVSFPYGFPEPGLYRMWVQMKYRSKVYTGVFDLPVE